VHDAEGWPLKLSCQICEKGTHRRTFKRYIYQNNPEPEILLKYEELH